MKRSLLLLCSVAAAFAPALRRNLSTANGAAEDILEKLGLSPDSSPDEVEAMRIKLIDATNPAAVLAGDELQLGGLVLPTGLNKKDVLWRRKTGLSTKHAVQAALAQKRHDDAVGKAKADKAKQPGTASAALVGGTTDYSAMTVAELVEYTTRKKIELVAGSRKADIIAAIEAFDKQQAKEERDAS